MIPKDSILAAKIDAVFESTQELFLPVVRALGILVQIYPKAGRMCLPELLLRSTGRLPTPRPVRVQLTVSG